MPYDTCVHVAVERYPSNTPRFNISIVQCTWYSSTWHSGTVARALLLFTARAYSLFVSDQGQGLPAKLCSRALACSAFQTTTDRHTHR